MAEPVKVELTDLEWMEVEAVGLIRALNYKSGGAQDTPGSPRSVQKRDDKVHGAGAEKAVAKWSGKRWNHYLMESVNKYLGWGSPEILWQGADVGEDWEVRLRLKWGGGLIIRPRVWEVKCPHCQKTVWIHCQQDKCPDCSWEPPDQALELNQHGDQDKLERPFILVYMTSDKPPRFSLRGWVEGRVVHGLKMVPSDTRRPPCWEIHPNRLQPMSKLWTPPREETSCMEEEGEQVFLWSGDQII